MKIAPFPLFKYDSDSSSLAVPARKKKGLKFRFVIWRISNHVAYLGMPLCRLTRCGECGGDNDGDTSDARCTDGLAARNNRHMDFRRTDSSGRTDADSTRKDNN